MSARKILFVALFILNLILAACAAAQPEPAATIEPAATSETTAPTNQFSSYNDLVTALEAIGATVIQGDPIEPNEYGVPGRYLSAGGARVDVYEFADEAASQSAFARNPFPSQASTPYLYSWNRGRLIVYCGACSRGSSELYSNLLGHPHRLVIE